MFSLREKAATHLQALAVYSFNLYSAIEMRNKT